MATLDTTRTAKGLIALTGNRADLYVTGSLLVLVGGSMEWDERCGPRCPHGLGGSCHTARYSLIPTGLIDRQQSQPDDEPVERITDANGDETERGADTDTHQQDGDHR